MAMDLLVEARETLTNAITPVLSGLDRYNCLMIANALRIVERQFTSTHCDSAVKAGCLTFDGHTLTQAIRDGQFDSNGPMRAALLHHVRVGLLHELAVDNPRMLEQF
ncbi:MULTISPECIES: DUF6285 domain-containing protein [Paraburkholderia]|uniref:DUF6285 domain-containing protein n=1 Tax=Paraburkholderia TaxID=1822464 RepID=UPI002AB5EE3F|nr:MULTISPECIES: DUF6285 domain-containing protein [Paraburkholderia]